MNVVPLRKPRVELNAAGHAIRAFIPSHSQPGIEYEMLRRSDGSWTHADTRCQAWIRRNTCSHLQALELM